MFEKRTVGNGILFVETHTPGAPFKDRVIDGDTVVLKISDESILIKDVKCLANRKYRGIIYGFEPSYSTEFLNLKIDDEVEFEEDEIISCSPLKQ